MFYLIFILLLIIFKLFDTAGTALYIFVLVTTTVKIFCSIQQNLYLWRSHGALNHDAVMSQC